MSPPTATILAPFSYSSAIELGNATWRKRILPIGQIDYQGRTLHFTRAYLQGLVAAFRDNAYDQIPLQFADAANTHTNDPERTRGTIVDMELADDGLYVTAQLTERGQQVLRDNPYLGVSARIVEHYQRSDGKFYPAAIQHVLGTLDPRIPGLGAWQQADLANSGGQMIIDLSGSTFPGEPGGLPQLSPAELNELLDAISEADEEGYGGEPELSDAEMNALIAQAEAEEASSAMADFNDTFDRSYATAAAREAARAELDMLDTVRPARREQDKMDRALQRAQHGLYDTQAYGFAAESAAVELAMTTGRGPCGPPDSFGRCSSRYHQLDCAHSVSVDWLASEPPASTYAASLANLAAVAAIELAGPELLADDGEHAYGIPQHTLDLAAGVADWSGLHGDPSADWFTGDMLRPISPEDPYDAMAESIGYGGAPEQPVSYPGVRELAERLQLR